MTALKQLLAHDPRMRLSHAAAAIGVSGRTLQTHCRRVLGMSPRRYQLLRRMAAVRRALMRADPATSTVTLIAAAHGFFELGRFAVRYRALFGEPPSATLARNYKSSTIL